MFRTFINCLGTSEVEKLVVMVLTGKGVAVIDIANFLKLYCSFYV